MAAERFLSVKQPSKTSVRGAMLGILVSSPCCVPPCLKLVKTEPSLHAINRTIPVHKDDTD